QKTHFFRKRDHLDALHHDLLSVVDKFGWRLEAWAVFSNHYHFVAHSPTNAENAASLSTMLTNLHRQTAIWINQNDGAVSRRVWHNYRDTNLSYQRSYLVRLNYVHQNPVRHGLVAVANQYPWCSARWLEREASPAMIKSIYGFKTDRISIPDDFAPIVED
ncbi:MAG TPA: transposase, partial [Chthoniobacterales bacterium]